MSKILEDRVSANRTNSWDAMATSQLIWELQYTSAQVSRLLSDRRFSLRCWNDDLMRQVRVLKVLVDLLANKTATEFQDALTT